MAAHGAGGRLGFGGGNDMLEHEPFLQTILEHPEADWPRLVYGDWLEERGETAHAELIRVQCEMAKRSCRGERRQLLRSDRPNSCAARVCGAPAGDGAGRASQGHTAAGGEVPAPGWSRTSSLAGASRWRPISNLPWDKVLSVRLSIGRPVEPGCWRRFCRGRGRGGSRRSASGKCRSRDAHFRPLVGSKQLHQFARVRGVQLPGESARLRGPGGLAGGAQLGACCKWWATSPGLAAECSRAWTRRPWSNCRRIGASPSVAGLKWFGLGVPQIIGPACVQTLLDAPYLTDKIDRFNVTLGGGLPGPMQDELRNKFPRLAAALKTALACSSARSVPPAIGNSARARKRKRALSHFLTVTR